MLQGINLIALTVSVLGMIMNRNDMGELIYFGVLSIINGTLFIVNSRR